MNVKLENIILKSSESNYEMHERNSCREQIQIRISTRFFLKNLFCYLHFLWRLNDSLKHSASAGIRIWANGFIPTKKYIQQL